MKKITRGRFLKTVGAGALAGSTLSILSACAVNTSQQGGGDGGNGGEGGDGGDRLNLYNWSEYIAESNIADFERETGARVTQDFYASNEELLAKLQAGGSGYDIIVPSDYMVAIMAKSGVLQELDFEKIPNFENVGENFRGLSYDPENEWSIPYQWGTTGILYNREEVGEEVTSWDVMWDERFQGRVSMLDDVRETLGAALMRQGYSINSTDEAELEEAKQLLLEQKPLLRGYFPDTESEPMVAGGNLALAHVFSGTGILSLTENEGLAYAIPEPGATRWTDNFCVPNGALNPDLAHEFINFLLGPEQGAALTNYTYYGSPNEAALPMIDEALTDIPEYAPSDEVFERLQVIEDVGEATRQYERIFTEVKSA
ncbi:MAG: ABC transporter substrate-binding protein [Rubrobacteraceae bacterium]